MKKRQKRRGGGKEKKTLSPRIRIKRHHDASIRLNGIWPFRKFKVKTFHLSKQDDNEVVWSTNDGTNFALWFPRDGNPLQDGDLESTGGTLTRRVDTTAAQGDYPYYIFCYGDNEAAVGDSPPTMIIDP